MNNIRTMRPHGLTGNLTIRGPCLHDIRRRQKLIGEQHAEGVAQPLCNVCYGTRPCGPWVLLRPRCPSHWDAAGTRRRGGSRLKRWVRRARYFDEGVRLLTPLTPRRHTGCGRLGNRAARRPRVRSQVEQCGHVGRKEMGHRGFFRRSNHATLFHGARGAHCGRSRRHRGEVLPLELARGVA